MQLKLDLSSHCIETELKRKYNQSISQYFKKKKPNGILEERIENLELALKTLDFGYLRKEFPVLAGHHDDEVVISFDTKNKIAILINGKEIKKE